MWSSTHWNRPRGAGPTFFLWADSTDTAMLRPNWDHVLCHLRGYNRVVFFFLSPATDFLGICTNGEIVTSQMNHRMIYIGRQRGHKHVSRKHLLRGHFPYWFVLQLAEAIIGGRTIRRYSQCCSLRTQTYFRLSLASAEKYGLRTRAAKRFPWRQVL